MGNLHPTYECDGGHVVVAIVYQSHLTLKVTSVLLETFSRFHLNCKEVVVVPPQLPSESILVAEGLSYFFGISERLT